MAYLISLKAQDTQAGEYKWSLKGSQRYIRTTTLTVLGEQGGVGGFPGNGNGNSLQYSCLENLMGREAW